MRKQLVLISGIMCFLQMSAEVSTLIPASAFVRCDSGVYVCDLSAAGINVAQTNGYFSGAWHSCPDYPALCFGNEPMTLAREPNKGWKCFEGKDNVSAEGLPESGFSLAGYWTYDWAFEVLRVDRSENGKIVFKDRHEFGIGNPGWGTKIRRFYAVNHLSFLDAAGEWYFDAAASKLYFLPPGGDIAAREIRFATGKDPVLTLENEKDKTISGRTIAFGGGHGIELKNCHNITIADCVIECVSGNGIVIRADCTGITITNCVIRDIGRCGVVLSGGDRKRLKAANNKVTGCEITRFGLQQRVYAPGVSMYGCGNAVTGCRIHDAPHSAIIYGGNEHLIADNEIWDVIKETGDAGAIYSGRDWTSQGNMLVRNYIHNLGQLPDDKGNRDVFTMGVYLDDCDCGDTLVSNVFERAGCAVMIGGGRENVIFKNRMIDCDIGIHLDARGVTWTNHWNNPNDSSWNLIAKAKALDYGKDPWKSKYPRLADIMNDEPRLPKYNRFLGNEMTNCRMPYQFEVDDAIWAHIKTLDKDESAKAEADLLAMGVSSYNRKQAISTAKALLAKYGQDGKRMPILELYRFYQSGLADEEMKKSIRDAASKCAVADSGLDCHATCEFVRKPAIQLALWKICGDGECGAQYDKSVDQMLEPAWGKLKDDSLKPIDLKVMSTALEVIRLADSSRANRAEALMKEVALIAMRHLLRINRCGAEEEKYDAICAVAMVSKIESIEKLLGNDKFAVWKRILDECLYGLDGTLPPWEARTIRVVSLMDARARLGK